MDQKKKLTIHEQIEYMSKKGVKFNILSKEDAEKYLKSNTYFFKIKAYAKNYEKYRNGIDSGKYVNLEFAYLKELSVLDFHLRRIVMSVCVNIEHMLKVTLNSIISEMPEEDGYQLVNEFQIKFAYIDLKIKDMSSHYTEDLKRKLGGTFASWNIVELLTFNDIKKFFEFCTERWGDRVSELCHLTKSECKCIIQLLHPVRHLRNAAAHNNCLIHRLKRDVEFSTNKILAVEINKHIMLTKTQKGKKFKSYFLHDFTAMLILFKKLNLSDGILKHTKQDLKDLIERINLNKSYFNGNNLISSSFAYLQKVIDIL